MSLRDGNGVITTGRSIAVVFSASLAAEVWELKEDKVKEKRREVKEGDDARNRFIKKDTKY